MNISDIKKDILKGRKINIVFIGDSITSTEWVHPNWREIVEYVLKEELTKQITDWKIPSWSIRCYNFGFDGSTTKDILDRIQIIKTVNPTIVMFLANSNDLHPNIDLKEYKKQIEQIIIKLHAKTLLMNMIPGNQQEYNNELSQYAEQITKINLKNSQVIDTFSEYSKFALSRFFTFKSTGNPVLNLKPGDIDYVHPNQLGNAYIAKIILEKGFNIKFNPEKFMKETLSGQMYPGY